MPGKDRRSRSAARGNKGGHPRHPTPDERTASARPPKQQPHARHTAWPTKRTQRCAAAGPVTAAEAREFETLREVPRWFGRRPKAKRPRLRGGRSESLEETTRRGLTLELSRAGGPGAEADAGTPRLGPGLEPARRTEGAASPLR